MSREHEQIERAIALMERRKADLVALYAEAGGGYTEPIGMVRQWSKTEIVNAILDLEYPELFDSEVEL